MYQGQWLHTARTSEGDVAWRDACRDTGRAVAELTKVPLDAEDRISFESRFYGDLGTLEAYLGRIIDLGHSIAARDPEFGDAFWHRDLDFIESPLDRLLSEPRALYHQDVSNFHVQKGEFMGFFDLEMCRVGCASMQLGAAACMFLGESVGWAHFREGYEAVRRQPLSRDERRAAAAAEPSPVLARDQSLSEL